MSAGSTIVRTCVRGSHFHGSFELCVPQLSCHARMLWPAIVELVQEGGQLFLFLTENKALDELRMIAREKPDRLGTHFPRRRAARAIMEVGDWFAKLLRSGQWHASVSQLYLDLDRQETQAMASILIEASDDEHKPHVVRGRHGRPRYEQVKKVLDRLCPWRRGPVVASVGDSGFSGSTGRAPRVGELRAACPPDFQHVSQPRTTLGVLPGGAA